MTNEEKESMFLDLNSVFVKFWIEKGRPDKEIKIEILERMLNWYKNMGYITQDDWPQPLDNLEKAAKDFAHFYDQGTCDGIAQECFIAGANWQKEQDKKYIDLGLSSGTKWASCNVGANKPEEYGTYHTFEEVQKLAITVPTIEQWDELINECNWKWTSQNGVNGYLVTGSSGNSIFLPAAGYRYVYAGSEEAEGYYWSSSLNTNYPDQAWFMHFGSDDVDRESDYRDYEQSVRAVLK